MPTAVAVAVTIPVGAEVVVVMVAMVIAASLPHDRYIIIIAGGR
jgi:hypothetical protein